MFFNGTVVREIANKGSKSQHLAFVLNTQEGSFKLRRVGANPFKDDYFKNFVDCNVSCEGDILSGVLVVQKLNMV